ncbi:uncharacterized [Tachysurus ichikawai]
MSVTAGTLFTLSLEISHRQPLEETENRGKAAKATEAGSNCPNSDLIAGYFQNAITTNHKSESKITVTL